MHSLLLEMAYHSQGAFSYDFLYDMPLPLRRFNMFKLSEIKEKEAEEARKASKKSTSSVARPPRSTPRRK